MQSVLHSSLGLYPGLLGGSWCNLDDSIRSLHGSGGPVRAVGVFQVHEGSNRLARMLARLAQLPAAGEAVDVQLQVTEQQGGEKWHRTFAGRPLVSLQSSRADGLLAERMGLLELRFRLAIVGGALSYRTVSAALCLGSWRVPLPRWLSPSITAWERPVGDTEQIHVSVDVNFPLLGRLIAYDGKLTRVEVPG